VSEEFRKAADLADAAFRANLVNLSADPGGVRAHDELLARSCVFGYLYDRHFLQSAEMLLNELRWLRAMHRPEPPRHAIHPERFASHRNQILDMLVTRFQSLLDYRDELGHEAPVPEPLPRADATPATTRARAVGKIVSQSSEPDPDKE
jgi:hypothetical protein